MSIIVLNVDEVMRTLSNDGQYPFVVNDKTVDIVRFALNTGFTDVALDEYSALRVMYQRPGETEVRAQTLTYYDTDGLRNYYDWQLLSADLEHKGTITCALCILRTDSEVEEWHTAPCQIRVLNTIHTDDSDEGDETITPTVAQRVAVLETMIQRVASGAPIVVSSTSAMTDTDQIYVLSSDRKWYYHNGATWVAGGEYGAVATDRTLTQSGIPADAKVVGDAINEVKADLGDITEPGTNLFDKNNVQSVDGYILGTPGQSGTINANANARIVYIPCEPNTTYTLSKSSATARFSVAYTTVPPSVGVSVYGITTYASNTAITITTGADAEYLVAFIYLSSADTGTTFEQICAGFQIQIGSSATEYEPYSISAKDDVARARIGAVENLDALDGKYQNLQVTAVPQAARIGSALTLDISSMTGTGNATFSDGAWHVAGGGSISGNVSGIIADKTYLIEMSVSGISGVSGDINTNPATVTLGDASLTFFSAADANWNIALAPTTGGTVTISFTFNENWSGNISAIIVKPVNALAGVPQTFNNIPLMANFANIAVGGGQKKLLLSANGGRLNSAYGINAQRDINTGTWNTSFGYNSQLNLTQGKGNNAFGCFAQNVLTTGCYNNAFGESAQNHITEGQWNDGFGIETQGMATSAKNNVAFGRRSQHLLTTGNFNVSVGAWSGFNSHDVSPEGKNAIKTSSYITLIGGASTLNGADTGDSDYATALGYQTKVGKHGVALGALSEADEGGIAIGYGAVAGANEVVIGNKKIIFNNDHTVTWVEVD